MEKPWLSPALRKALRELSIRVTFRTAGLGLPRQELLTIFAESCLVARAEEAVLERLACIEESKLA